MPHGEVTTQAKYQATKNKYKFYPGKCENKKSLYLSINGNLMMMV